MTVTNLVDEVRKLSRQERVELLEELMSIVQLDDSVDLTPEQQRDLEERIDEYRSGKAKMISGPEALERLRNGK